MKKRTSENHVCKKHVVLTVVLCVVCMAAGFGLGVLFHRANTLSIADYAFVCTDGADADKNGCCPGEVYTDMGDKGFNCCPETGGNCFPPLK